VVGDARPAMDVRAEKRTSSDVSKIKTPALAIPGLLDQQVEPMSRVGVRQVLRASDALVRTAVTQLLADETSGVVEVAPKVRRWFQLWYPTW